MVCTVQGVDKLFNLAGLSSKQGISSAKSGEGGGGGIILLYPPLLLGEKPATEG